MKRSERRETQNTTNTYGWQTPTDTPDIQTLREQIRGIGGVDPMIGLHAGNMRENAQNRFNNPYGANYSPETRDAMTYNDTQNINQRAGAMMRDSRRRGQLTQLGAQGTLAQMTGRRLVNTGGSSSGTVTQQQGVNWAGLVGAGMQGGSAAMMA